MKVVIVGNTAGLGGAQTAFRRLAEFLLEEGHEVGIIALGGTEFALSSSRTLSFQRAVLLSASSVQYPFRKGWSVLCAGLKARQLRPDMFIATGPARSAALIARVLPSRTFKLCQDFIHGRRITEPLFVQTIRAFDAIAVQAPSMIAALSSQGRVNIGLDWLPCFPEMPLQGFRRRVRAQGDPIRLAYFGRLAPNKGLDVLLSAFAQCQLQSLAECDIWGSGPELDKLRNLAGILRLYSKVQFKGAYPSGCAGARLMCSYDAVVLTSTGLEGLPLVLLEAMAYGIPFLATDVGAVRDICDSNPGALLVSADMKNVSEGLNQLIGRIAGDEFDTPAILAYYDAYFSRNAMSTRWRQFLDAPRDFFSSKWRGGKKCGD